MDQISQLIIEIVRLIKAGSKDTKRTVRTASLLLVVTFSTLGICVSLAWLFKNIV